MKFNNFTRLYLMISLLFMAVLACNAPTAATAVPTATLQPTLASTLPVKPSGVSPVNLPEKRADQASDPDSSANANKKKVSGGDTFVYNLYERPFNADPMDVYFPHYDILETQGFMDETWGYATITLSNTGADGKLTGRYGVEVDLNREGRGDWLILVTDPRSTEWSTEGVQVWKDANSDVGGNTALVADKNKNGNGYETLVFDQGKDSSNPDGAWARLSASDPRTIELAFKLAMLDNPKSYAMGAWAGSADILNPAQFDFNDHMTHIQAGSPLPGYGVYPLKAFYEVDNTCRLAIGFAPTGKEVGLCKTIINIRPGEQPAPGAPSCPNTCPDGQDPYPSCECWPI